MVIYTYLPKELLQKALKTLTFEEFFELYGQTDCAREMRIEDIETGVAKGIADNLVMTNKKAPQPETVGLNTSWSCKGIVYHI